jgi:hypothetical protein
MPIILRILLALLGLITLVIGLNAGLGGIHTLGWQYTPGFATEADPAIFNLQDNHAHFLGGIFAAAGLILTATAFTPKLAPAAITVCIMTFIGGLFRLIDMDAALFADWEIMRSLVAELLLYPALAYWMWRSVKT